MLHVAHLTSAHNADDVRILHRECKALQQAGFRVTLVAPERYNETGVDYCGVDLKCVKPGEHRVERMTSTSFEVLRQAMRLKADVYHIHDPELLPGLWTLKAMGAKTVYDVHEDLPKAIMAKAWVPSALRALTAQLAGGTERFTSHVIDGIVAATRSIGARFPANKTIVLNNYPVALDVHADFSRKSYVARPTDFVYAGVRTRARGIAQMVDAMEYVADAKLQLVGTPMPDELRRYVTQSDGWPTVVDGGWVSRAELGMMYGKVRAGLLALLPAPNHVESRPNKLFEYMGAGLPIIASDFPLWREMVEGFECGLLVDPERPASIAKAMNWILRNPDEAYEMGQRGAKAVRQRYNWGVESRKLVEFYKGLAAA